MQRLRSRLLVVPLLESSRGFCTSSEKIVASVLFERLRVVIPKPDPAVYTFQEFNFAVDTQMSSWTLRRTEPRVNTKWTMYLLLELQRLTRKTIGSHYIELLTKNCIFSSSASHFDKPVWHFPEKVYNSEPTLRTRAESALKSVLGDLTHTYFVGNAPMAHMAIQPTKEAPDLPSYKRFFFKCSVVAASKYNISNCEDFVWVTKDELLEFFPEQAEFFNKMIIS